MKFERCKKYTILTFGISVMSEWKCGKIFVGYVVNLMEYSMQVMKVNFIKFYIKCDMGNVI